MHDNRLYDYADNNYSVVVVVVVVVVAAAVAVAVAVAVVVAVVVVVVVAVVAIVAVVVRTVCAPLTLARLPEESYGSFILCLFHGSPSLTACTNPIVIHINQSVLF